MDERCQDHRRAAEMGHALVADQREDHRRVDLAQADMGAADGGHRPGERPAVTVEHRQGPQIDRALVEACGERHRHGVQEGAAMVVDDTLRIAGRP